MADSPFQILDSDSSGARKAAKGFSKAKLLELHGDLLRQRLLDEEAAELHRTGRIGFFQTTRPVQALDVGCADALDDGDWLYPGFAGTAAALRRGWSMTSYFHQLFGAAEDEGQGRQLPMQFAARDTRIVSMSPNLATRIPQAVGTAMAARISGDQAVAVVSFGVRAAQRGGFHVGMGLAAQHGAPIVFLARGDGSSAVAPGVLAAQAATVGLGAERVDGGDVLAVSKVMADAIAHARGGGGAVLVEAGSTGAAQPASNGDGGRSAKTNEHETSADPLDRFERYLMARSVLTADDLAELRARMRAEVTAARAEAEGSAAPDVETMFRDVFAAFPPNLIEQRIAAVERRA